MTVTQVLMKPGQWSMQLKPHTPYSVWGAIDLADTLVITPTPLQPISGFSDANILAAAIYSGPVLAQPDTLSLAGADWSWWLGADDGTGDIHITPVTQTAANLATWIAALRPNSVSAGTVTSPAGTWSYTYHLVTPRESITHVCRMLGAEWRLNPNGTLDAAVPGTLFSAYTTPTAMFTRRAEGPDGALYGVNVTQAAQQRDLYGYASDITVVARNGDGNFITSASAAGTAVYKNPLNNNAVLRRLVDAPDLPASGAATMATATVALFSSVRRPIVLSSKTYAPTARVKVGDSVWVYDPAARLVDTANQVDWRGERISPIKLRCKAVTWPLQGGMGFYIRKLVAGVATYIDITPYVLPELDDTTWEIGAAFGDPDQDPSQLSPAFLGVNPAILGRSRALGQNAIVVLASDQTNNNAVANTMQNVTGLAAPVLAGRSYFLRAYISYDAAATTTGSRWSVTVPAGTTARYRSEYSLTATTRTTNNGLTTDDAPAASNATSLLTGNSAIIEGTFTVTTSGNIQVRFASEVAGSAITARSGVSYLEYREIASS